jgi:coenzyme F420-reducing hydrogenase beta subunit
MPIDVSNKVKCFGCGACASACPQGAIKMVADQEGFLYPSIDASLCTQCDQCVAVCPEYEVPTGEKGSAFALRCNDSDLLYKSTSGGAFSLLSQKILSEGGIVFGAVFDEDFKVVHKGSDDISGMRKSKYVQSDMTKAFKEVKDALSQNKKVLFSGTPCQCHALSKSVTEHRENLITVSVVCRGVASPELWKQYVAFLEKDGKLRDFCFRDKRLKNSGHTVSYSTDKGETAVLMDKDPFSTMYLKCLTLRPSCYSCPYTKLDIPSDITIGDFWGIEKIHPDFNDGMGVSLVIARTEEGKKLLKKCENDARILPCPDDMEMQSALKESAPKSILRMLLFKEFATSGIYGVLKKFGGLQREQ